MKRHGANKNREKHKTGSRRSRKYRVGYKQNLSRSGAEEFELIWTPMEAINSTKDGSLVNELDHQEGSDFSDDEMEEWATASLASLLSSAVSSAKNNASGTLAPRRGIPSADETNDHHRDNLLQSLAPIRRPGVDPGESAVDDDDASLSSFIRALALEERMSIMIGTTSSTRNVAKRPIGKVNPLLDTPSDQDDSSPFDESKDDVGFDTSLFVDANNGENLDGFFKQGRPDPPASLSSRCEEDQQSVESIPPPPPPPPVSDSSSDAGNFCDAYQNRLDQRLHGSFLSDQLGHFLQRNTGSNNNSYTVPPKPHTWSVNTFATALDTTSDNSYEKNNLAAHDGQDKIEENDKRPCCCCYYRKVLLLLVFLLIVIISAVSATSPVMVIAAEARTEAPTTTIQPSSVPSNRPSTTPTSEATISMVPSKGPTLNPSSTPSSNPTYLETETIFYAIGDVPYHDLEKIQLEDRMKKLPKDGEFVIHVGDIRSSGRNEGQDCRIEEYQEVHKILRKSKIPVFIIPGDNEWNDCPNPVEGKRFWRETFTEFDKNWDHNFQVVRHPVEPENFFFVHKRTLYFGLTVLGGNVGDRSKFNNQLKEKFEFVKAMIDEHVVAGDAVNVVIFGHAFPVPHHWPFFDPLREYINTHLENKVPVLYLNGDYHFYESEKNYLGFSNFNRLQVAQGTHEPPLKVAVTASNSPSWNATEAFSHDRMLWLTLERGK